MRLRTGRTVRRGSRGIALPFHVHGTRRGEGSASRPGRSLPLGKTRYPLCRRLGGPQGRSGQVTENLALPPGFDPQTVQPVAICYTDCATRPTNHLKLGSNFMSHQVWHSKVLHSDHTAHLSVLDGSQNKQLLFPFTALTCWILQPKSIVFTARCELNF